MSKYSQEVNKDKKLVKPDNYNMILTENPKTSYLFGTKGKDKDFENANTELKYLEPGSRIDYTIKPITAYERPEIDEPEPETDEPDPNLNEIKKTLSFMNVRTIEEGIEWYRKFDPKIPEDLLPLMARWNWGDLSTITKKQIRNERKKQKKKEDKNKKKKTTIEHKNTIISF